MSCLTQAPAAPSLASPIGCVVMIAAVCCPGCRGHCKGSLTLGYYLVKV